MFGMPGMLELLIIAVVLVLMCGLPAIVVAIVLYLTLVAKEKPPRKSPP